MTVFAGRSISRFPVRLVGSLPDSGITGLNSILVRAGGNQIQLFGGVPDGTSGSPVYIGGRLIGAISAQYFPDTALMGVTPIEDMRNLAAEPGSPEADQSIGAAVPAPTKATVIGLTSGRALGEVAGRFGSPVLGHNLPTARCLATAPLQPGSAIAAAAMTGDIKLGFIGTATVVDDTQVLAFGHPLLFSGPSSMALTTAEIAEVARGEWPRKLGNMSEVIGTVLQDRAAGIYARLDVKPRLIPLHLTVRDEDRDHTETLQVQIAPLPSEIPFLAYIAALECMQRAMNRVGSGSAAWDWTIAVSGSDAPTVATGAVYDLYDIGGTVAAAVLPVLEQLLQARHTINSINLTATVTMRELPELGDSPY
ncbi:MAG: hypothetical protein ACOX2K_04140 [Bacillota bacterium]